MDSNIEKTIKELRWIAILRADNKESAIWAASQAIQAGTPILELTYSIPHAELVLAELKKVFPKQIIGMGTVTTREQGEKAMASGADFLVSPHLDEALVKAFTKTLYIPGVFTPSEIYRAQTLNVNWCKIFPASVYGPHGIKTLLGPMPDAKSMNYIATGGVTESNSKDYFKAGVSAVGVGSNIFSEHALTTKDEHHIQKSVKVWQNSMATPTV